MNLIKIILLAILHGEAIQGSKLISSSCVKDTKWNSKNVGRNLRRWIDSILVREDYKIGQTYTTFGFWDEAKTRLKFAGVMNEQNRALGRFWSSLALHEDSNFVNGFLYGNPDAEDTITDDTAIFLYPDLKTALVGSFNGSVMLAAQQTKVVKERCERGVKRIKVKRPENQTTVVKVKMRCPILKPNL
ncbi:uncharacterized protein LOC131877369 isoform X2 [Tigriopus californicus]|uniref:uncharacterized protein LOC131877369 isoform X2 n=1 Tax=Tigriopus californicus TaxID=6832 RepID=UPI0027D9CF07|nr:uncharacterized protein LOC131877369 isoform X2 [Tigriopus californicus]